MLVLMSSFLFPRMKGGVGISAENQDAIYDAIKLHMIHIASKNAVSLVILMWKQLCNQWD